ncbi:MAG TPA: hypothetical protein VF765_35495 [Polyangiaceae bacterium]
MSAEATRSANLDRVASRARRAYELGMLRLGVTRGAVVACLVGILSVAGVISLHSGFWLLPVFVVWSLLGWRGSLVWRGALSGLGPGLAALALPVSLLRPCCASMMTATDCSMPQMCIGAGAVLGLVVVLTLPRLRTTAEWARASGGALLAVASIVATRCVTLFVGEVLGLAGGLLASAVAVSMARAWWASRPQ